MKLNVFVFLLILASFPLNLITGYNVALAAESVADEFLYHHCPVCGERAQSVSVANGKNLYGCPHYHHWFAR